MNTFQMLLHAAYGYFGFHNDTVVAVEVVNDENHQHQKQQQNGEKEGKEISGKEHMSRKGTLERVSKHVEAAAKEQSSIPVSIEDKDEKVITATTISTKDGNDISASKRQGIGMENLRVMHISKSFVAGGVAGAIAKTVVAPLERTKIIFQTSQARFSLFGLSNELYTIVHKEGFSALWRGHTASLARVIPYSAIQLTSYDIIKGFLLNPGERDLPPAFRIAAGGLAGGISVICTYPLDLVRARMAVQRDAFAVRGALRRNIKEVYRMDGIGGLYKGLFPTMLGIVPYSGLAFGTFGKLCL